MSVGTDDEGIRRAFYYNAEGIFIFKLPDGTVYVPPFSYDERNLYVDSVVMVDHGTINRASAAVGKLGDEFGDGYSIAVTEADAEDIYDYYTNVLPYFGECCFNVGREESEHALLDFSAEYEAVVEGLENSTDWWDEYFYSEYMTQKEYLLPLDLEERDTALIGTYGGETYLSSHKVYNAAITDESTGLTKTSLILIGESSCTNHSYSAWTSDGADTHSRVCLVCGYAETVPHTFRDTVTLPTATEEGYTTHICTVCGHRYIDSEIPANTMTLSFSTGHDVAGGTAIVHVNISNNPGINSMDFKIGYDQTKMTLVSVTNGDVFSPFSSISYLTTNPVSMSIVNGDLSDSTENGTLVILTFTLASDAAIGDYPITVSEIEAAALDNLPVTCVSVNGIVRITSPGDIDGDGSMNVADALRLRRYIAGFADDIGLKAADVNRDGNINIFDVLMMRKAIVGLVTL